jgi:hypothetical protein
MIYVIIVHHLTQNTKIFYIKPLKLIKYEQLSRYN